MSLSIILPVLNEAEGIAQTLGALRGLGAQVIVADGGSRDGTIGHALLHADLVIPAPRGRAMQMNAGAREATGDKLLFLHADTKLPAGAVELIEAALQTHPWGRFDVRIDGHSPILRLIGGMMNLRSRLTGIATGDQAMFMTRKAFDAIGGFPELPLMEDIAASNALKRIGPPACLRARARTSGRRWEKNGVLRTVLLMWRLRLQYFFGADPRDLALRYGYRPREEDA